MRIPLTQGKFALVDNKYYKFLMQWKWYFSTNGYAVHRSGKKTVYMHRLVAALAGVDLSHDIDHRDGNKIDNRRRNLRSATRSENHQNQRQRSDSTTKYKGVHPTWEGSWHACITVDGSVINLGTYKTQEQAAAAYDHGAVFYFGKRARINGVAEKFVNGVGRRKARSGLRWVYWDEANHKWKVTIWFHKRNAHIGMFTDKIEAAIAANKAARKLFGKNAYQNPI